MGVPRAVAWRPPNPFSMGERGAPWLRPVARWPRCLPMGGRNLLDDTGGVSAVPHHPEAQSVAAPAGPKAEERAHAVGPHVGADASLLKVGPGFVWGCAYQ